MVRNNERPERDFSCGTGTKILYVVVATPRVEGTILLQHSESKMAALDVLDVLDVAVGGPLAVNTP